MAKKKTAEKVKIEATPVLRVEPTPDPEETSITKSYAMRDDWKDEGITNYVAFKSVDGEVQDLTVNGEPAGGGGSSDGLLITRTINADEIPCLNKTWNEINTAYTAQLPIMYYKIGSYPNLDAYGYVTRCQYVSRIETYYVDVLANGETTTYSCTSGDERPAIEL